MQTSWRRNALCWRGVTNTFFTQNTGPQRVVCHMVKATYDWTTLIYDITRYIAVWLSIWFTPGRPTADIVLELVKHIYGCINGQKKFSCLFIDMRKAFAQYITADCYTKLGTLVHTQLPYYGSGGGVEEMVVVALSHTQWGKLAENCNKSIQRSLHGVKHGVDCDVTTLKNDHCVPCQTLCSSL